MCAMLYGGQRSGSLVKAVCDELNSPSFWVSFASTQCVRVCGGEALIKGWPTCHNQRRAQYKAMFDLTLLLLLLFVVLCLLRLARFEEILPRISHFPLPFLVCNIEIA